MHGINRLRQSDELPMNYIYQRQTIIAIYGIFIFQIIKHHVGFTFWRTE